MTEEEITIIVSQFLVANWKEILVYASGSIISIALTTWFLARHWHAREINHHKQTIKARDDLDSERTEIFKNRIEERNSYSQGIMQLADQRVRILEQEKSTLKERIDDANIKLAEYQRLNLAHGNHDREIHDIDKLKVFYARIQRFIKILRETDPNTSYINFNIDTNNIQLNSKSDYMIYIVEYNKVFETLSEELLKSKISEIKMEFNIFECQNRFYKGLSDIVLPLTSNPDIKVSKEEYLKEIKDRLELISRKHNKPIQPTPKSGAADG